MERYNPIRPKSDFIPKDWNRQRLLDLITLHINDLPEDLVLNILNLLDTHYNIRPIKTRHLPYVGDDNEYPKDHL